MDAATGYLFQVAAVSGDARRALDICRRAVELAQSNLPSSQHLVGLPEVDAAAREMLSSSKIIAISKLALQEKLFLRSLLSIFSKSGTEEAVLKEVWRQQTSLCRLQGMSSVASTTIHERWHVCVSFRQVHTQLPLKLHMHT